MDTFNVPLIHLLNQILNEYNDTLRSLLSTFDTVGTNTSDLLNVSSQRKILIQNLIKIDSCLSNLYKKVQEHQVVQSSILKAQINNITCDEAKIALANKIYDSKKKLEIKIIQATDVVKGAGLYSSETSNVQELIRYAKKISQFTSAPPNYSTEKSLQIAEPPYPSELKMRMGLISSYKLETPDEPQATSEQDHQNDEHDFMDPEYSFDIEASDFLLDLDLNPDLE